jgi:sugar/nucleoside kinase (ribokinase family)
MTAHYDCLCAGIIVADFLCAPVSEVPHAGGVAMTDAISLAIGGCASNVAVDLCRLERKVAVAGLIGDDLPGRFVREELARAGVDIAHLAETAQAQTSSTLVINVRGQDRRFIHAFGANALFDGAEISRELIAQARVLYLGGFFLMPAFSAESAVRLFRTAREANVPTVLDVVIPDQKNYRAQLDKVLPWTDVFLPNADEGRLLTELADPLEQAGSFHTAGAKTVVVTCGAEGAVLVAKDQTLRAGRFPVEFVDGTGSGDAFAAGYISGMLEGFSPGRCLEIGSALGASCVRRSGATTGVFSRPELESFLLQNRLAIERL